MTAEFNETEDSVEESVTNIVESTWQELKIIHNRLRKHMLRVALTHWVEKGYVVVPDDYMED